MKKWNFHAITKYATTVVSALIASKAMAVDTAPSTVLPSRVSQDITATAPEPALRPGPNIQPKLERSVFPPEVAALKLTIKSFVFKGNTLFTDQQLLALFQKKMNTEVTLGDIEHFTNEITLKYNKAGFLLSQAVLPAQSIKNGVIQIEIIEGYVDKVMVIGEVSDTIKNKIRRYGEKIVDIKPLNIYTLERSLLLANDLPGIQVKSIISPSKENYKAAEVTLVVAQEVVDESTYIDYDNRGTRYIGPTRNIASLYFNSMLGGGATTGGRIASSGRWKQMRFVELEHRQYVGIEGLSFDIDGQFTRTEPGFLLQGTQTIGTNKYVNLSAQYAWVRQRAQNLYLNASFLYVNSFLEQFDEKTYNDQIRTLQLSLSYNSLDSYRGSNQITGAFTQGLNVLGASQPGNLVSRVGAKPVFSKFNLSGGRLQGLPNPFSLMLTGNGQFTNSKMYAYEQIGYGGLPFGDAYDPSEIIADRGLEAKLELRLDKVLPFTNIPTQYFVYADGGVIWNFDHINQEGRQTGTSTGFGLRSTAWNHVNISLELAKPLDRDVAATAAIPGGGENPRAWRGFFSVSMTA